jgi:TPR repeat protein
LLHIVVSPADGCEREGAARGHRDRATDIGARGVTDAAIRDERHELRHITPCYQRPVKHALLLVVLIACGSKKAAREDAGTGSGSGSAGSGSADAKAELAKLDAACTANDVEACRKLAIVYEEGIAGVTVDHVKATQLFRKACEGRNFAACNQLALALSEGLGIEKNPANAAELYQRTCDAGYKLACRNLGLMLRDGRGVPVDLARAATLLDNACTAATAYACTNAGDLDAKRAESAPDDATRAQLYKDMIAHYKRGCDDGDPTSCRNLGIAYLEGKALPTSTAAASVWLSRGCRLDDPIACRVLGAMTIQGLGVDRDHAAGVALLSRACDRKDTEACNALATIAAAGSNSIAGSKSGSGSDSRTGSASGSGSDSKAPIAPPN